MIKNLKLQELELNYGSHRVCGPVNAEFAPGRVNLVVGRAGSGKSTLLKAIAGFHTFVRGKIFADDQVFASEGNIALAFQNPENLFFNPSVGEEVCFALKQQNDDDSVETKGKEWLEKWGLEPEKFWAKHPIELSGGEKRKVALAACTVLLPDIILLDEPLAGLDYHGQQKLAAIIRQIALEHIVIVVTHDPETLFELAHSLLFLRDGQALTCKIHEFVNLSLGDPDFYPLPDWYRQALQGRYDEPRLPLLQAQAVHRFLLGAATDADYLFAG